MSLTVLKIKRLGKIFGNCEIFDFENIPQGYIKLCGTGIPKPKGSRKFAHINKTLINPSDDQVIEYAKKLMTSSDMFNTNSEKNPNDYTFEIVEASN